MTFPVIKSARKLTGIVKITIPEVFPEMKPLGNVINFPVQSKRAGHKYPHSVRVTMVNCVVGCAIKLADTCLVKSLVV